MVLYALCCALVDTGGIAPYGECNGSLKSDLGSEPSVM